MYTKFITALEIGTQSAFEKTFQELKNCWDEVEISTMTMHADLSA